MGSIGDNKKWKNAKNMKFFAEFKLQSKSFAQQLFVFLFKSEMRFLIDFLCIYNKTKAVDAFFLSI